MSSALFLLNYKFLRPSYFEKIGWTGRTDGQGTTVNAVFYAWTPRVTGSDATAVSRILLKLHRFTCSSSKNEITVDKEGRHRVDTIYCTRLEWTRKLNSDHIWKRLLGRVFVWSDWHAVLSTVLITIMNLPTSSSISNLRLYITFNGRVSMYAVVTVANKSHIAIPRRIQGGPKSKPQTLVHIFAK